MSELTDYFVRHYTLVLDNEQRTHNQTLRAARRVVVDSGVSLAEYKAMPLVKREELYAEAIGDRIGEIIESEAGNLPMIASEVMMHYDGQVQWGLGKHYMPEDSDMDGYLDEDEECEGHESTDTAHMGEAVYCDGSCR